MKKTFKVVLALALVYSFTASFASAYTIEWGAFPLLLPSSLYGKFDMTLRDSDFMGDTGWNFGVYSFRIMSDYGYSGNVNTTFLLNRYLWTEVSAVSESGLGADAGIGFVADLYLTNDISLTLAHLSHQLFVSSNSSDTVSDSFYIKDSQEVTAFLKIGEWYDLYTTDCMWPNVWSGDQGSVADAFLEFNVTLSDIDLPKERRVSEPSTVFLLATGLGSLGLVTRRWKR